MPIAPHPGGSAVAVDPEALRAAARFLAVARDGLPAASTLRVGAHDTHAAGLDAALDEFRDAYRATALFWTDRTGLLALLLVAAADRYGTLEQALEQALAAAMAVR